jgi:hypothetical protein
MTPEDLEQIRGIAREETAAAEARIVDRLTETMSDVETKLLTAFHGYASGLGRRSAQSDNKSG